MNDLLFQRLVDTLRETNRQLETIATKLDQRQPYKPLLIHLGGNDITAERFELLREYLKDYFETVEGKDVP